MGPVIFFLVLVLGHLAQGEDEQGVSISPASDKGFLVAKDNLLILHPSLTSTAYLEAKPTSKRHGQHTDFKELKSSLLNQGDTTFLKL